MNRRRWQVNARGLALALPAVLAWLTYKAAVRRPPLTRMIAADCCATDADAAADMSRWTPGAAPIRCAPWDIGTGVTGYVWRAPQPRAALLLLHGHGDYAQRYVHQNNRLIPHLLNLGVTVYAFDLWGNGRSPGSRGAIDVDKAIGDHLAARRKLCGQPLPVFLLGHSLGGLVTATSLLRDQAAVRGTILLSPALRYPVPAPLRLLARVGGFLAPTLPTPIPTGDMNTLTHDPEAARKLRNDPLMYLGPITWLTAAGGARFAHSNWALYPQVRVPLLVVHGTADKNTDPSASRQLVELAASADKTMHLIEGGLHALLDDTRRDETLNVILHWLEERLPPQWA